MLHAQLGPALTCARGDLMYSTGATGAATLLLVLSIIAIGDRQLPAPGSHPARRRPAVAADLPA
jgi:hypothetical protein